MARRVLRRSLRPLLVRLESEQAFLEADIALGGEEVERLAEITERLERRISELTVATERHAAYADAMDAILGEVLLRELPADARIHRRFGSDGRGVVCSLATGRPYRSLLSRSALSFERYAQRWNWDLVLSTEDLALGRPAPWGKVPLIRALLDEYVWVPWLDADVVVTDLDADISEVIRDGKDLYLVEHNWGQYTANSGVMLVRSSDWSRAFFEEVWAKTQFIDHPFWENAAVLDLLGYAPEPARLVQPTPWLTRTQLIDRRWNSIEIDPADRPAFVHRGFFDARTRTRQVTGDLPCVLGDADPVTAGRDRPARHVSAPEHVHRREELPALLNALGLTGAGVVAGVGRGEFCAWVLEAWAGERLLCIDPWASELSVDEQPVAHDVCDSHEAEARRRLARFGQRAEPWASTTAAAATFFPPAGLDFVYLSAQCDESPLFEELNRWWPLLRPGGVMAGRAASVESGVQAVATLPGSVESFFGERGIEVHMHDGNGDRGWVVRKPTELSRIEPATSGPRVEARKHVVSRS